MKALGLARWLTINGILLFVLVISMFIALLHGSEVISLSEMINILVSNEKANPTQSTILLEVRLPRILVGAIVGGILAICGVVYQALLRNPLADPFILGVSSGAALGVYLAMMIGLQSTVLGFLAMPVMAFIGAILAVGLVYQIAVVGGRVPITGLLLSGVVVNAILSALILFLTSIIDAGRVMTILLWIMGHIRSYEYITIFWLALYTLIGTLCLFAFAKSLNLLTLGEEQAMALGMGVEKTKRILLIVTTFLTGVAVSVTGIIGFIGIIAPHAVRMVIGPDHRIVLPASFLLGAAFLVLADTASRTLLGPTEIPVGVLTALCGGPFFLLLLKYRKHYAV